MIVDLDAPSSRDPVAVGSKAAALAAARAIGAPVLPGFVVAGAVSRHHMALGAKTLPQRGSGGARLVVSGEGVDFGEELVAAGRRLGDRLVARSSTLLEAGGEWSGAFASYVDVGPDDLPKAVAGCWASAFSVAALERQEAAGVEPGSFPMSVLIQPALQPEAGGWAELGPDGSVVVYGIKGPPAPLLQGWATGHQARYHGSWTGEELVHLVGLSHLESIRALLDRVGSDTGAVRCEWALTDRIWCLQVARARPQVVPPEPFGGGSQELAGLVDIARVVALAPGALGEELVLPWALAGLPDVEPTTDHHPVSVERARVLCRQLTEGVWAMPWDRARPAASRLLSRLRAVDVDAVLPELRRLRRPDPEEASRLLGVLRALRFQLVERGVVTDHHAAWSLHPSVVEEALAGRRVTVSGRMGVGRWEPLVAAITLAASSPTRGTPASPGVGAGRRSHVDDPHVGTKGRRGVITADQPVPNLSSLLWDAAGLVTGSGSPAAHLFEAARALRVPAVCGIDLNRDRDEILAVDGYAGVVASLSIEREL